MQAVQSVVVAGSGRQWQWWIQPKLLVDAQLKRTLPERHLGPWMLLGAAAVLPGR